MMMMILSFARYNDLLVENLHFFRRFYPPRLIERPRLGCFPGTYLHIPKADSCPQCPGAFPAGLRQRRVGGYSCPPNAPTPVGSKCSGTTDLQSETLRPHHRRTHSLHWLRVRERIQYKIAVLSYKVRHDTAPRYLVPLTRVADIPGRRALRSASTDQIAWKYLISNFPPSAAELFRLPPHRPGAHYQTQSFRHQHYGRSSTN